jgi:formylglycine-generating enzyme required for sulfatase activity
MNDSNVTRPYEPEPPEDDGSGPPHAIGRYRVERILGKGGFGVVYLAWDEQLRRKVAIKVPHRRLVARAEDAGAYLTEARTVAGLDHPNIVPVFDAGSTEHCPCYVVSKYVDGSTLKSKIGHGRSSGAEAARLVAIVAETLHYAHRHGIIHRDVKPGNILLDGGGKPYVADFGLALKEENVGHGPRYAGTPAYMSPEQACGEGHRVDGRSDIFSLGVVLYELLTGRPPFHAPCREELLEQIAALDVRPPRQWDDTIPKELERICLKALAKRASERYTTAKDLADDLRQFLGACPAAPSLVTAGAVGGAEWGKLPAPDSQVGPVVPKGLRAFDADDADFFLDLLPGPRDRHGLPEAVRFWKGRIEQSDPEETFAVGLLYGPSGCGKSSLVKAGLLPRLAPHVKTVYLEATADLEARLLHRLRRSCPEVKGAPGLAPALAAVRRRRAGPPGEKVLLVLDQFEQWLHAHRERAESQLVRALRQCDGGRLQCLVMVRDDFWMMSTRFMRGLEVPVVEGHNAAGIDLFPPAHARKVLTAFGRAYGALPGPSQALAPAQTAFLDRAVAELTQDGWVIPVRLALFADMVKGRPWTGETLRELGGAVGIGVTFLDESFTAASAPPEHRLHQAAVRAVLRALLPGPGTDIRGSVRSRDELLEASGYRKAPAQFDALMRILIGEARLLTPIAADSAEPSEADGPALAPRPACYQLTHDYLVPSIREWLARKQRETRRGRAELRLAERDALWRAKPERRQLPSLAEWLAIRLLTKPRTWTDTQRQMMRAAARKHLLGALRWAAAAVLLLGAALFLSAQLTREREAAQADALVQRLLDADLAQTTRIIDELGNYRAWADPRLEEVLADPAASRDRQLRALLALLPEDRRYVDRRHVDRLRERLLEADPGEFPIIRDALAPYRADLVAGFWEMLQSGPGDPDRRFRAAAALASYDPASPRWDRPKRWVAGQLVAQPTLVLPRWVEAFGPVKHRLIPGLLATLREGSGPPAAPAVAAEVIGAYAAGEPMALAEALAYAPPKSFAVLFARLRPHAAEAVAALTALLDRLPPDTGPAANATAGQRANLAIALLRLGAGGRLWPLLKASDNPRARSFAIDRFAALGCPPDLLLDRLGTEPDDTIRAALWLGLGGYDEQALPPARRRALRPELVRAYHDDASAAVHAAACWLLGKWGMPAKAGAGGEGKGWYVNAAGLTMVRIAGPVTFMMGSPPAERGRDDKEKRHEAQIDYAFDIGMTEVTAGQFQRFLDERAGRAAKSGAVQPAGPAADKPATKVRWYLAAEYCNWLNKVEGIPDRERCYEPNAKGEFADGMRIAPGYQRKTGYRLPTEREWEYACRGGAATSRCYGDADELLPRYAWYAANAAGEYAPVARLLPNAFGLFDMHGNAAEWCQDTLRSYDDPPVGGSEPEIVHSLSLRCVRGGGIFSIPYLARSAKRFADRPSLSAAGGFRVARGAMTKREPAGGP